MPAIPTVVVQHPKTGEPITINQSDYLANQKKYKLVDLSKAAAPSAPAPAPEPVSAEDPATPAAPEAAPSATEETDAPKSKKKKIFG